jgi:isoquinoline 1-oxidoreductase alpha subunit
VPQCGYCQSGQIMATVAFLKTKPNPTDADIDANLTNICRCGTYERLRRAVHRAAALMRT